MDFAADRRAPWRARPNVHLAFWNSPASQRLYLPKPRDLSLAEYIQRWQADDFARIRAYRYDEIRDDLWAGSGRSTTSDAGMTSFLMSSSDALAVAARICGPVSKYNASGGEQTRRISISAAHSPARSALHSANC